MVRSLSTRRRRTPNLCPQKCTAPNVVGGGTWALTLVLCTRRALTVCRSCVVIAVAVNPTSPGCELAGGSGLELSRRVVGHDVHACLPCG
eukprot:778145-Prymnesium_polylepis.1